MITNDFLSKLAAHIESQITSCQYILKGKALDIPIHSKEVNESIVKVNILLDENVEGNITEFRLYDANGDIAKQETCNIIKTKGRGLHKTFSISVKEVI
jgi:hypothetical protein